MGNRMDRLLQEIQMFAGCIYISDLCSIGFDEKVKKNIEEIPIDKYTLEEWNEVAEYIARATDTFQTIEEAKAKIINKQIM